MNRQRLIKTAYTALAALMLAACASDELTDGTVQDLPEGKYPLQISSVTMSAESTAQPWGADAPQTRVAESADGKGSEWEWNGSEQIGVKFYEDEVTYTLNTVNNEKTLTTDKTLYWKNKNQLDVTAWYPATDGKLYLSDQSKGLKYVMTGSGTGTYNTPITLNFTHQLAKIRVTLTGTEASSVTNVKINSYTTCTNTHGTVTNSASVGDITMYKTADKTWEANVVPGYTITKLKVNDTDCTLEGSGVTPVAGQWHKVTITVKDPLTGEIKLSDYSDGATLRVAGTATIKGNSQSKDLKIIIKNGAQVTLDNVILKASTSGNVITCQNNATITLTGSNNITGYGSGTSSAILVEGGILTIEGTGSLEATGKGAYSCGIGAINSASIVINNGSLDKRYMHCL